MIPLLASELIDIIIDHLYDDKLTLASCSLVSHTWLPATRYHLFSGLHIQVLQEGSGIHDVLYFLESSPSVRGRVCRILLSGKIDPADGRPLARMDRNVLPALISKLPHLLSMELVGIRCPYGIRIAQLYKLNQLSMTNVSRDDIFGILDLFTEIKELHLERPWFESSGYGFHPFSLFDILPRTDPLVLHALSLRCQCHVEDMGSNIANAVCLTSLSSFSVCCETFHDMQGVATLMQPAECRISSLKVEVCRRPHIYQLIPWGIFGIQHYRSLQSLYIVVCDGSEPSMLRAGNHMLTFIPLCPNTIRHLTFEIGFASSSITESKVIFQTCRLGVLDLLGDQPLVHLESVTVVLKAVPIRGKRIRERLGEERELVERMLPNLAAQRLLRIQLEGLLLNDVR